MKNLTPVEKRDIIESAFEDFQRFLDDSFMRPVIPYRSFMDNCDRAVVAGSAKFYCVYVGDWFKSFNITFKDLVESCPNLEGLGVEIKVESANKAKEVGCTEIAFIHKEGFFVFNVKKLIDFCDERDLYIHRSDTLAVLTGYRLLKNASYVFPKNLLRYLGKTEKKALYKEV